MKNIILAALLKRRDKEEREAIKKRWEVERLKAELNRLKEAQNEVHQ